MNSRIAALALMGIVAVAEKRNPPAVALIKQEGGEWRSWGIDAQPSRPCADDMPVPRCQHDHKDCCDWRGVHFHALRFADGRIWDARNGWRGV